MIKRFTLIALAFLTTLLMTAVAQEASENDAASNIANGQLFMSTGDCELAQYYFREALRTEPDNAEALLGNGRALACRFAYDLAVESFRQAIDADPNLPLAYVHLALTYQAQHLSDPERYPDLLSEALAVLSTAERIAPDNTQVLNTKGVIQFQLGQYDAARESLEHAAQTARTDDSITPRMESVIQVNLGKTYRDLGTPEQAVSAFRRAVVLDPASAAAHSNLGNALFRMGECASAEYELQQAVSIDPQNLSAVADLAITLFECGNVAASVPHFEEAVQLDGAIFLPPLYTYLSRGLVELGRYDEAVRRAVQGASLWPVTADARYWLGAAYCARGAVGDDERAQEAFTSALEIDPAHELALPAGASGCSAL